LTVDSFLRVFVGLLFGGNPEWRLWDFLYGAKERLEDPDPLDGKK
jgi:hypothetical protein